MKFIEGTYSVVGDLATMPGKSEEGFEILNWMNKVSVQFYDKRETR